MCVCCLPRACDDAHLTCVTADCVSYARRFTSVTVVGALLTRKIVSEHHTAHAATVVRFARTALFRCRRWHGAVAVQSVVRRWRARRYVCATRLRRWFLRVRWHLTVSRVIARVALVQGALVRSTAARRRLQQRLDVARADGERLLATRRRRRWQRASSIVLRGTDTLSGHTVVFTCRRDAGSVGDCDGYTMHLYFPRTSHSFRASVPPEVRAGIAKECSRYSLQ